jgi:hypothetical protein
MLVSFLLCSLAFADDVITLEKGEKAPFSGTLLSPDAAAKIIVDSDHSLQKCLIDSQRDLGTLEAKLTFEKSNAETKLAACTLRSTEMANIYEEQITYLEKRSATPSWHAPAYFTSGIVLGIGAMYGSSIILKNIGTNQ